MGKRRKSFGSRLGHWGLALLLTMMGLAFINCGNWNDDDDDGGTATTPAQVLSGVFVDSAVSGLNYATDSFSGTTDAEGAFSYREGETVTFSIGDLVLGSAPGTDTLSPIDIVEGAADATDQRVVNICVLLQTLDQDGDLNNGIQITTGIASLVSNVAGQIDFDQSTADFAADDGVTALVTALNDGDVFADTDPRDRALRSAATALAHLQATLGERYTVTTVYGDLRGFAPDDNTWAWRGVPYAKPPVGDLRWRAPQPPEVWTGTREAVAWGDQAAQHPKYEAYANGGMSEDCLYLNITAPRDADNLPVMVWFHGGGFVILTGNTDSYNNAASLPTKDVVLVTVNHRLGPFGFLAHPWLTAEAETEGKGTGNYGQLDLIAALEWIQDNIAAFGGNPGNVTIFGESGGGGKSISLMASPLAEGLFHKAICQSGTAASSMAVLNGMTLSDAEAIGTDLVDRLGVTTLEALRNVSWVDIIMAEDAVYGGDIKEYYGPVIDGHYMTDVLGNLIQAGLVSDVPFMVGVNSGDMAGLPEGMAEQMPWRSDNNSAPQYAYIFTHVPELWAAQGVGAYHGIELVYVFNYPASFYSHYLFGLTGLAVDFTTPAATVIAGTGYGAADIALADTMMTMWANFAATGDPSISGAVQWLPYTTAGDNYLEISAGAQTMRTGLLEELEAIEISVAE